MISFLLVVLFGWLAWKTIGLALHITWGIAKLVVGILFVAALPLLIVGLLVGSIVKLLLPLALIGFAFAIVKSCA